MRKFLTIAMVAVMLLSATSCAKKNECAICGKMKECTEKTSMGETIHVCHDCLDEIEGNENDHDDHDGHNH